MRVIIQDDKQKVAQWVAFYLRNKIRSFIPTAEKPYFVLGLPTGGTPVPTYELLVAMHKRGELSFKNVVTFNMDEYVGLPKDHPESYHAFMWTNLFKHVDIRPENVHILDGMAKDLQKECEDYEAKITFFGGIDLFLGGLWISFLFP